MRGVHHVLSVYTILIVLFVLMFAFVVYVTPPNQNEVFTMALSIVLFALIPLVIAFLVWRHHKR